MLVRRPPQQRRQPHIGQRGKLVALAQIAIGLARHSDADPGREKLAQSEILEQTHARACQRCQQPGPARRCQRARPSPRPAAQHRQQANPREQQRQHSRGRATGEGIEPGQGQEQAGRNKKRVLKWGRKRGTGHWRDEPLQN